jgi:hypothetical protein
MTGRALQRRRGVPIELRAVSVPPGARRFRLMVVALASPIPATVRLRAALKALLRAYRLRCEAVEEIQ